MSGSRLRAPLTLVGLALALLGAKPVQPEPAVAPIVQRDDHGDIDWTAGELRALGVGTPKILSPTAGVTRQDLYRAAVADAQARLGHLLDQVRLDSRHRLGGLHRPGFAQRRQQALGTFEAEDALHFTDGTVHVATRLSLAWAPSTLGVTPPADAAEDFVGPPLPDDLAKAWPVPTGVVLRINGALSPSLRIALDFPGEPDWQAGVAGDPVAATGMRWFRAGDPLLVAHVGASPREIDVRARGVGSVALDAAARAQLVGLSRVPTAVVLP